MRHARDIRPSFVDEARVGVQEKGNTIGGSGVENFGDLGRVLSNAMKSLRAANRVFVPDFMPSRWVYRLECISRMRVFNPGSAYKDWVCFSHTTIIEE